MKNFELRQVSTMLAEVKPETDNIEKILQLADIVSAIDEEIEKIELARKKHYLDEHQNAKLQEYQGLLKVHESVKGTPDEAKSYNDVHNFEKNEVEVIRQIEDKNREVIKIENADCRAINFTKISRADAIELGLIKGKTIKDLNLLRFIME